MGDLENKDGQQEETTPVTPEVTPEVNSSTAELEAYKKIHEEDKAELEKLRKELNEVKIANAKLAIRQPAQELQQSPEELLNEMFK